MNSRWLANKLEGFRQVWAFDNRWQLVVHRTLFQKESVCIYRLGKLEVLVDHAGGDANGAREVLTTSMYTDYLGHLRFDGPVKVLDCGANNGGFALLLVHLGILIERIVCVELNPRTCVRLRFNLDRNLEAPHQIVNAALCGRSGSLTLELGAGGVGDSIYERHGAGARSSAVRAATFDEVFAENFGPDAILDICKIDIEYAEYEMLSSPGHALLDRCRVLIIEIHPKEGSAHEAAVRYLEGRGFELLPRGADPDVYAFRNRNL